jgi:cation diffusion facilitator family transporter
LPFTPTSPLAGASTSPPPFRNSKALGSAFLVADAAHTRSDVYVTLAVSAALVLSRAGVRHADAVVALLVLLVIARVAWRILQANLGVLVDRAMVDAGEVRTAAMTVDGVIGVHRIRSRGQEGAVHLDLHLLVDGTLALRQAHEISHRVEDKLRSTFAGLIDVTIHVEPEDEPEESL